MQNATDRPRRNKALGFFMHYLVCGLKRERSQSAFLMDRRERCAEPGGGDQVRAHPPAFSVPCDEL